MRNKFYLNELEKLKDNLSVKVITGVRGVGKTTLLKMFAEDLIEEGVSSEEIIFLNFAEDSALRDFRRLFEFVNGRAEGRERIFLLFDEIQYVEEWDRAINAFFVGLPAEIYLTTDSEGTDKLKEILSDNCDVIKMYPLHFAEYSKSFFATPDLRLVRNFLTYGSLYIAQNLSLGEEILSRLLFGTYYEIILKDVVAKNFLRDTAMFDALIRYLVNNIGKPIFLNELQAHLYSEGFNATRPTLENYLNAAVKCGLFVRIERFDAKTRSTLNGGDKFYCIDNGLISALKNFAGMNEKTLMENAVCIELVRRGYDVKAVKLGTMQIDFRASSPLGEAFIQVVASEEKLLISKALRALRAIGGECEKILIMPEQTHRSSQVEIVALKDFFMGGGKETSND